MADKRVSLELDVELKGLNTIEELEDKLKEIDTSLKGVKNTSEEWINGATNYRKVEKKLNDVKTAAKGTGDSFKKVKGSSKEMSQGVDSAAQVMRTFAGDSQEANTAISLVEDTMKGSLNVWVAVGTAVAVAAVALFKYMTRATDAEIAQRHLNEVLRESNRLIIDETLELEILLDIAKDVTQSLEDREEAIKRINKISPGYLGNITLENIATKETTESIDSYTDALLKASRAQAFYSKQKELANKLVDLENRSIEDSVTATDKLKAANLAINTVATYKGSLAVFARQNNQKEKEDIEEQIGLLKDQFEQQVKNGKANADKTKDEIKLSAEEIKAKNDANDAALARLAKEKEDRERASASASATRKSEREKKAREDKKAADEEIALREKLSKEVFLIGKNKFDREMVLAMNEFEELTKNLDENNQIVIDAKLILNEKIRKIDAEEKTFNDAEEKKKQESIEEIRESYRQKAKDDKAVTEEEKLNLEKERIIAELDLLGATSEQKLEIEAYYAKQIADIKISEEEKVADAKRQINNLLFNDAINLAETFFAKEGKMSKDAFNAVKAMKVAQAIIATYQGANAIFASAAANPATVLFPAQPFLLAGSAIANGLINVKKILSTKIGSSGGGGNGGGGGGSNPNTNTGGVSGAFQPRNINLTRTPNQQIDVNPIKVFVTESDISSAQINANNTKQVSVIK